MPHRYADRIAQALSEIKDEDEVWGEITAAMQRTLKEWLEGILEREWMVGLQHPDYLWRLARAVARALCFRPSHE